jgi:hypothetical protein
MRPPSASRDAARAYHACGAAVRVSLIGRSACGHS